MLVEKLDNADDLILLGLNGGAEEIPCHVTGFFVDFLVESRVCVCVVDDDSLTAFKNSTCNTQMIGEPDLAF